MNAPTKEAPQVLNKRTARAWKPGDRPRVYIGRGSIYGNPYVIGQDGTRDEVCDKYEAQMQDLFAREPDLLTEWRQDLKDKDLVCYCKPARCHGDFLLRLVNEPATEETR